MKLGKREASHDPRDLVFSKYAVALPTVPARFGYGTAFKDWHMLGNDRYGDCVWAGSAHEVMLWTKVGAAPTASFTDTAVLSDYSAMTGFDPNDPSTDQGTDMRQALLYRKKTGVLDAHGQRHRIGGFVKLEPGNWTQLLQATFVFGACAMGFQFPDTAMTQFNQGKPWDVVTGAQIEGGHYVPVVGSTSSSKKVACVTWGKRQELTRAFYTAYNDESFAVLSPEILNTAGVFRGFDLTALKADLAAL